MSGKYSKKKKNRSGLWTVLTLVVVVALLFAVLWIMASREQEDMPLPSDGQETTAPAETAQPSTEVPFTFEAEAEGVTSFNLGPGLDIVRYGKYIGLYMEDGTDQFVENVMMIVVENTSEQAIQYAKITVSGPSGDAVFTLSTLMPGDTVVVLEASRKPYSDQDVYTTATLDNLAVFQETPGTMEDQLLIQPLDGGFNITNISGQDITGRISVYFKDVAGGMYYGGITYVCNIDGGMKADEVRQIMSSNFTEDGSRVVFVQIAP